MTLQKDMCPRQPQNSPIVESVLERIQERRLAMRSRLGVAAERLGLESLGVLLFLVVVLAVNLILFWAKATGAFRWFGDGALGLRFFLESFPYQWLIVGTVALIAAMSLRKAGDVHYQPLKKRVVVAVVLIAASGGTSIAFSGLNERLLAAMNSSTAAPAKSVYSLTTHHGQTGVVGRVVETLPNGYVVEANRERISIIITTQTQVHSQVPVASGDRILVISPSARGATVQATSIRKLQPIPLRHIQLHHLIRVS